MSDRFFLEPGVSTIEGDLATFGGDEAHHFCRVLRGSVGDVVTLFDGSGLSWRGIVEACGKSGVSVRLFPESVGGIPDTIESPVRLTLASALPKGERQRFLIEKLAELGVARFVPLRLERSVARADEKTTAKFRRYVIEAAKQCGRNVLMEITEEKTPAGFHALLDEEYSKHILHPASLGAKNPDRPRRILHDSRNKLALAVGPEGSFTDAEVETALALGFRTLDLGARILRTETACIAAAAVFLTF